MNSEYKSINVNELKLKFQNQVESVCIVNNCGQLNWNFHESPFSYFMIFNNDVKKIWKKNSNIIILEGKPFDYLNLMDAIAAKEIYYITYNTTTKIDELVSLFKIFYNNVFNLVIGTDISFEELSESFVCYKIKPYDSMIDKFSFLNKGIIFYKINGVKK